MIVANMSELLLQAQIVAAVALVLKKTSLAAQMVIVQLRQPAAKKKARIVAKKLNHLNLNTMKLLFAFVLLLGLNVNAKAQITQVSLQASGLTCSMCSKAVKNALEEVSFVDKVEVDIKNQQYNLSFKEGAAVDFDVLGKAVEDAGFSVAKMKVTADVSNVQVAKDMHIQIGNQYFHFLNAKNQALNGTVNFNLVDKHFVSAKEFKRYSGLSKMECVQTGKTAKCCANEKVAEQSRIYHAII